jgi:hypothetical protein
VADRIRTSRNTSWGATERPWTPDQLREQELFEAEARKQHGLIDLSYRYMEEDSREYDNPYTRFMFRGWLMRARSPSGVRVDGEAQGEKQ